MTIITRLLLSACKRNACEYTFLDDGEHFLVIRKDSVVKYVVGHTLGLNHDVDARLMRDKFYSYLLINDLVSMPLSKTYIDPASDEVYKNSVRLKSIEVIADEIVRSFELPVIVKMNSGTKSRNVFLCHNREKVIVALRKIYSKKHRYYDHVALVQKYIEPVAEYRAIMIDGQVKLLYSKRHVKKVFCGQFSVNTWNKKCSIYDKGDELFSTVSGMAAKIYRRWPIVYAGLDLIEDNMGNLWLIEFNSSPLLTGFVKQYGEVKLHNLADVLLAKIMSS